jgi:hypothetical protein
MILKLFEKLNSPVAVVSILLIILAVNGYLFYQNRNATPEAIAPQETLVENAREQTRYEPSESEREETTEEASVDEEPQEPAADEARAERDAARDDPGDEPEDRPSEDSGAEDSDETGEGSRADEPRDRAPLAGLSDALEDCEGDRAGCVRDFVAQVSPESSYIGGRTDLASGDPGSNTEVLYFEDPDMEACQFERGRHEVEGGLDYTVILVGPGSFDDERGEECIPTA